MWVKCEYFNPLSSVKDRLALGVINWAEKEGLLKPGMTVVEATSGNTGIATAMVCAAKGCVSLLYLRVLWVHCIQLYAQVCVHHIASCSTNSCCGHAACC